MIFGGVMMCRVHEEIDTGQFKLHYSSESRLVDAYAAPREVRGAQRSRTLPSYTT